MKLAGFIDLEMDENIFDIATITQKVLLDDWKNFAKIASLLKTSLIKSTI